jgi:hypothetical protein
MKQLNMRTSRLSKVIGGVFALMSTLFAVSADATHIPVSAFTAVNAGSLTATSSCVSGYFTNNWQTPGTGYWDYTLNTTGFTNITMTFKNQKSSAAGPTLGSIYYNIGGSDVLISSFVPSTSCPSGFTVVNLPVACEGVSNLHIKVKMTGATANTATHRITSDPFDGVTSNCTGTPTAGSVTAGANPICAGTTTTLTLSGASAGGGITYQWQSSPNGSSWSNITGATNLTYNTPASLTASTYYRTVVTCPSSGLSANSSSLLETVNSVAFGPITGLNSTLLIVDSLDTIATTPAGGLWQSSNTSRATIDASTGAIVAKKGGTVTFTYSYVDGTTGCVGTTDTTVNIVWPNTLALYVGENGNSTGVIAIPGETVGNVGATNFGTAAGCTSGGISGLTVPVTVTNYNSASGPYVSYLITPNAGQALNIRRIVATTRESGTGPAKARIAYRVNGGAWIDEGRDVAQNTGGSCGAASTKWDFVDPSGNNPTVNGITSNIEVAVFPYAPGASTGTFQLNQLEVYGLITSSTPCSGAPAAGAIAETHVRLCDSGSYWLNFNGDAGVGISYQWQVSNDNISFTNISGATGASYNTGMLYAGTTGIRNFYRVVTTCSGGSSTNSPADTVDVTPRPTAGTITNIPTPFLHSGDIVNLGTSGATAGGVITWSSNDTSAVYIDRASGQITGVIPGFAVISAINTVNGCVGISKDSVVNILPNTVVAYIGKFGNSTAVNTSASISTASIAKVGSFGTTSACNFGGLSGMTTTVTSFNTSNPHVSVTFTAGSNFTVDGINFTLRRSNNGPQYARLAYRVNNGTWNNDGLDQPVDLDDCGYSSTIASYADVLPALVTGDVLEVAAFPINDAGQSTGGSFQVNSVDVTSSNAGSVLRPTSVANTVKAETIQLFPNPATNVLNVVAAEKVNVTILSIDGKKLIEQKNASTINISSLANGLYLIQVADANNNVIETTKFTKQ